MTSLKLSKKVYRAEDIRKWENNEKKNGIEEKKENFKKGFRNPKCKNQKYGHIYNKKGFCINCGLKYEK